MPVTFKDYLETQERSRFKEEGMDDTLTKFELCKTDRTTWDLQADF